MVVSSNFVVIRVEDKSLLPEYLFWLLNTEKIKRKIYENATSNMLGAVNARFLADFELTLLPWRISVESPSSICWLKGNANYLGCWQMKKKSIMRVY